MNILSNTFPYWVSFFFIVAIPIPILMIASTVKNAAIKSGFDNSKAIQLRKIVILFYAVYFVYVSALAFAGVFLGNQLPPRILLFTAIPLFSFLILVILNNKVSKTLIANVTLQSLVKLHLFRLIGIFFIILAAYNALPKTFAYIAGIGDIVTALSSIYVAKAIERKKSYAKTLTITWNIFGFADIISVIVSAIVTTKNALETGTQGVNEITGFPFCLIPAFAPATIIFLHLIIFKKIFAQK